jgi:hypothetical protein
MDGMLPQTTETILEPIRKRYAAAEKVHRLWRPLWEECYEHALPGRASFDGETQGQKRTDKIFDATAPTSLHEFASRLQAGLTPTFARWSKLRPGKMVPPEAQEDVARKMEEYTEEVFDVLHNSNFDSQAHEAYMELGVGTASLIADEDIDDVVRFQAIPLSQLMLDPGRHGQIDGRFRFRKMGVREMVVTWPQAAWPQEIQTALAAQNDTEFEIRESTVRDWTQLGTETHHHYVWIENPMFLIAKYTYAGAGACPWINARWSVAAGEVYGRGPLISALPDIKVLNALSQLTLENAELAVAGIWQAEDDGVVNPGQIRLVPGTIIPKAMGSRGLEPLQPPGRFDVGMMKAEELKQAIKRALFDEGLGPPTGTPMSATEVAERMQDLYRRMGSAYGRLQRELVQPVIRRVIHILVKRGRIVLPSATPSIVDIRSESPLSSAQNQQDVMRFQGFVGQLLQTFGPQQVMLILNSLKTTNWLAGQFGLDRNLINTQEEQAAMIEQMSQMAAQQGGQ